MKMRSPRRSSHTEDKKDMSCATEKTMLLVFESCIISPFNFVRIERALGSETSSALVSHGPIGEKFLNDFASENCAGELRYCHSRSE